MTSNSRNKKKCNKNNISAVAAKKVARDMKFVERFRRRFDLRVAVKSNKLFKTNGFVGDNH